MRKNLLASVLVVASSFAMTVFPAYSQTRAAPSEAEILAIISKEIPDFFKIDDLQFGTPASSEAGGHTRYIYRFGLDVSATELLFAKTRDVGPFAIIVSTINMAVSQQVSGVLDLTANEQGWSTGISFEHDFGNFGLPVNRFGQPVLILGEPETENMLLQLRDETQAQALEVLRVAINAAADEQRATAATNLQAERARNAIEILDIIADHATKRGRLIAEQRQQLSELETGLAIERQSLMRQVANAREVLALQASLEASLGQIAANDVAAFRTFTRMRAERLRLLDALPKRWAGIVSCVDDNHPEKTLSRTIEFGFDTVQSSGATSRFEIDRRGTSGQVFIKNEIISFPLFLDFSLPGADRNRSSIPESFSLELSASGRMQGTAPLEVTWSGESLVSTLTCSFDISG